MVQAAEAEINQMRAKVEKTEQGQQQIMGFLTQVVNDPAFLHQLLNACQSNNRVREEGARTSAVILCCLPLTDSGEKLICAGRCSGALTSC